MNAKTNNQLAQVCNNLHCIIMQVLNYQANFATDENTALLRVYAELKAEYNTLFKLIYGE